MTGDGAAASTASGRFGASTCARTGCCVAGCFSVRSGFWVGVTAASAVFCVTRTCSCSSKLVTFGFSLFQRLERCVGIVTSLNNGLSERETNDALNAHVSVISLETRNPARIK